MANKETKPGCSWKWNFLLFNAKSGYASMCCDHDGARANLKEVETEGVPIIINSPSMIKDRQAMLDGEELPHCQSCYRHITEDPARGGTLYENYNETSKSGKLRSLGIMLNTTCLYTCVYCSEHYSSSWYRDVDINGSYQLATQNTHNLSTLDKVQNKISIKDVSQSKYYDALRELISGPTGEELDTLRIGGGEPLLYESLLEFITTTQQERPKLSIDIYTGLGVSDIIFKNFIKDTIAIKDRLKIVLSQESYGAQAEFQRYGTNWAKWESMANQLLELEYHVEFNSVLNIMSLFTMQDFIAWKNSTKFKDAILRIQPLKGPPFMSIQPLAKNLHEELLYKFYDSDLDFDITKYIPEYQNNEREDLKAFLEEFARRRDLDIAVFPQQFQDWLNG